MAENTNYKLNKFQEDVLELIPDDEIDKTYIALKTFVDAYEKIITDSTKKSCKIS
jgi:hypothetical protein